MKFSTVVLSLISLGASASVSAFTTSSLFASPRVPQHALRMTEDVASAATGSVESPVDDFKNKQNMFRSGDNKKKVS